MMIELITPSAFNNEHLYQLPFQTKMKSSEINSNTLSIDRIAIHLLDYPAWIFDESTLQIVDGNKKALEFCQYEHHEFVGLSIRELWHGEDLSDILNELEVHSGDG